MKNPKKALTLPGNAKLNTGKCAMIYRALNMFHNAFKLAENTVLMTIVEIPVTSVADSIVSPIASSTLSIVS